MEPNNGETATAIVEEQPAAAKKSHKRLWLLIGGGALLIVIGSIFIFLHTRKTPEASTPRTAEEQEQLKYDAEQHKRDKQKTDQLRDQPYLVRRDDNNQPQLHSLLKDLNPDGYPAGSLPTPLPEYQVRAEEEAISHVLRSSNPQTVRPESPPLPSRRAAPSVQPQPSPAADSAQNPMFVYSRSFGGAKYVDAAQKQTVPTDSGVKSQPVAAAKKEDLPAEHRVDEKAQLIYTDYPPVILYEGEMLEAVLVNRVIADTEPSPVICQLSKDVYDHDGRYVVLPASSRIVGVSQVVNYKGAHRLFITFQRIILPDGPSVDLPSSRRALALDETGAMGVVSNVDRHWFLQFGTAIFFGILDGISGAAQRGQDINSTRSIILGHTSESYDRVLESIMSQYSTIVPTIRVDQGKTMKIYLSDDLLITPYAKISDRSYYANQ
jgi:type IV secretion system protein VirB10